jgi:hypothetical protein
MRTRTTCYGLLLAACTALLTALPAYAQQAPSKKAETAAARSRGAAGADENIKAQRAPNAQGAPVAAPASKGGERTRGNVSIVHLDNWTGYYIDLYIDGNYCATSGPWGDAYCYVPSGSVRMYGKAPFTDGSFLSWGPRTEYVDGTFDWKLTP